MIVRSEVLWTDFLSASPPRLAQPPDIGRCQPTDNHLGYVVLDRKDVLDAALVPLRPNVLTRRAVDKLGGYSDPFAGLLNAALEHVAHIERAAHVLDPDRLAFVGEGRVAGDDQQVT